MDRLTDVWRTEDRLHTDGATIGRLCELANDEPAIRAVMDNLGDGRAGNASVFVSGAGRVSREPVVLKLGARRAEREWMTAVDVASQDVVPRVFGSGEMRGVGWLVLERCEFALARDSQLDIAAVVTSTALARDSQLDIAAVVTSTARYQHAAAMASLNAPRLDGGWLREHLRGAQTQDCPVDLGSALAHVEEHLAFVEARCGVTPTHGDVHFANVVARRPGGPALLIDPMPLMAVWAWDAAYLEATLVPYQAEGSSVGTGLVRDLARERQALGLPPDNELDHVEQLMLGWAAAVWWRIAPWRHANDTWRRWVSRHAEALLS